jgi:hypothetical protein
VGHGLSSPIRGEGDKEERTEINRKKRESATIASSHSVDQPGTQNLRENTDPPNLEEIIRIVEATNLDDLPLCTKCGHRMFFPCYPEKPFLN